MPVIDAPMTAVVEANVHTKTYKRVPKLKPVHNNLGSSFFMYRSLISSALAKEDPKSAIEAKVLLDTLHKNMYSYWYESFNPAIANGYKLGGSQLSDQFIQAAAGKQTGAAAKQINLVSDKAFIQGYNAALNKGWERAVAWERISEAYGIDTIQMRKWITGYPTEGYHPESIPEPSRRSLMKMLFERSERISGHETWSAFQMGKQTEMAIKVQNGVLPETTMKVWMTAGDELVCPTCGPMEGMKVAVADTFDGFYAPPVHISCRCEIGMFIPKKTEVRKDMGADRYDRGPGGKFASVEGRGGGPVKKPSQRKKLPNSKSPFVIESDVNPWPSEQVAWSSAKETHIRNDNPELAQRKRVANPMPKKIDAAKLKAEADNEAKKLKGSLPDKDGLTDKTDEFDRQLIDQTDLRVARVARRHAEAEESMRVAVKRAIKEGAAHREEARQLSDFREREIKQYTTRMRPEDDSVIAETFEEVYGLDEGDEFYLDRTIPDAQENTIETRSKFSNKDSIVVFEDTGELLSTMTEDKADSGSRRQDFQMPGGNFVVTGKHHLGDIDVDREWTDIGSVPADTGRDSGGSPGVMEYQDDTFTGSEADLGTRTTIYFVERTD